MHTSNPFGNSVLTIYIHVQTRQIKHIHDYIKKKYNNMNCNYDSD